MSASTRESFGKGAMRRLRTSGNTPAVLYGNEKDVTPLQLETAPFLKSLFQISRKNAVVNLSINDGDTRHVVVKEVQTDPVTDSLVHADFHEIDLQKASSFVVALDFTGKAKGEEFGGELVVHNALITLEGLPLSIPDVVSVDVTDLGVGDTIVVSDITLPADIQMVSAGTELCVEVISATAAAAAAASLTAAADAAEKSDAEDAAAAAEEPAAEGDADTEATESE